MVSEEGKLKIKSMNKLWLYLNLFLVRFIMLFRYKLTYWLFTYVLTWLFPSIIIGLGFGKFTILLFSIITTIHMLFWVLSVDKKSDEIINETDWEEALETISLIKEEFKIRKIKS